MPYVKSRPADSGVFNTEQKACSSLLKLVSSNIYKRRGETMFNEKMISKMWLAGALAGVFSVMAVSGQSNHQQASTRTDEPPQASTGVSSPAAASPARPRSPFIASQKNKHADNFYKTVWGIESLEVREAASGALLRFSYTIVDANKAKVLNDEKTTPYMVDEKTGVVLQVPSMPKVGMLRQTAQPENGREYWMVFSSKGTVKPGSRVDVMIGNFRAVGLVVQ